jgi:hypothetical protein
MVEAVDCGTWCGKVYDAACSYDKDRPTSVEVVTTPVNNLTAPTSSNAIEPKTALTPNKSAVDPPVKHRSSAM